MKNSLQIILCGWGLVGLFACQSSTKAPQGVAPADATLQNTMQGLKSEIDRLLPMLISPQDYRKPENQAPILAEIRNLESISKNVSHSPAIKNQDPTLQTLSRSFAEEIHRSREAFEQGHLDYARGNLLNVTAYCMECHTRSNLGPSFQTEVVEKTLKTLKPLERGEYLLATRQFDAALKEFDAVIQSGTSAGAGFFDIDKATRLALYITVRFQDNPDAAIRTVDDVLKSKDLPYYLKADAQTWRQSLLDWKANAKKDAKKDYLVLSQELVQKGHAKQTGKDDRAGDIEMLRTQALLRPVLMSEKKPERLGHALFLAGVTYQVVRDSAVWTMDEDYFEECIRRVPHSDWSAQCYRKYEESILLGYTGSAGTSIPSDVKSKLDELQKLAL